MNPLKEKLHPPELLKVVKSGALVYGETLLPLSTSSKVTNILIRKNYGAIKFYLPENNLKSSESVKRSILR